MLRHDIGTQLALLYALTLVAIVAARLFLDLNPYDFASSPLGLKHGAVWQLLTSGLLVEGNALWQLPLLFLAGGLLLYRYGSGVFWRVALLGHVVATLLVYAAYAVLYIVTQTPKVLELGEPDFGISLVWAACLGALAISGILNMANDRFQWRELGLTLFCVAVFLTLLPYELRLIGFEHVFAFVFGAAAIALLTLKAELAGRNLRQY